ncbi:MAG TPA: DMT family transporter [Terriglobales bacterium]|nr:DMT family transporter [Terriglobales bacterium]
MTAQRGSWINFAALILVNLLWAAQYPAYKIAGDNMEASTLNFWMLLFAAVLLVPLWLREKQKRKREVRPFQWRTVYEYLLLGILGIIPPSVMLSWGISHSSASNAAILSLTIPILMIGLAVVMLHEKLTWIRVLSLVFGLVGTLLISTSDLAQASFSRTLLLGNFVILIAGLGSAFYNTYSKDLLSRYSELEVLIYSYAVGAIACAVISVIFETKPFYRVAGYSGKTWAAVAFLGLLSWGIAMVLWMWVLNRLEVSQISTSIYLLPLFGLILSVVTVHDRITLSQIVGGALTVAGTAALTLFENSGTEQRAESRAN